MNTITPLDVPYAIKKRRSIRVFKPDPIEPALIEQLINLTVAAPSASNVQPWRIVVVQNPDKKAALAKAYPDADDVTEFNPKLYSRQEIIASAPISFVFTADINSWKKAPDILEEAKDNGTYSEQLVEYMLEKGIPALVEQLGDKAREWAVQDTMVAATHLVLAAESLGLSTCMINHPLEDKVKEVIGVNNMPDIAIVVLVAVGYAAESRKNIGRLPLSSNVFLDTFGNPIL
ncbi:nitroreductase family protein [Moorena sp. SIO3I6]|uniref:nitroreductase family protein n=1 Tax=Moorena sp. SIO3I6 TaxID=2607831 RepID=UPI0013FB3D12|nr:nitroreductase family protein [Moorena sp. SIO3I6]NEP27350.1 nitroreductase [Moorena sp. SIO3I6]